MHIAFRADASSIMGSGHIMRCLTLANWLKRKANANILFICANQTGNLITFIRQQGFEVAEIQCNTTHSSDSNPSHFHWLENSLQSEIQQSQDLLQHWVRQHNISRVNWLILDHYALDKSWQSALSPWYKKLMVIDDIADREHIADLLLDQNAGKNLHHYQYLIPKKCVGLFGPAYAILKQEFSDLRQSSLRRKQECRINTILVSMGGSDPLDYTGQLLDCIPLLSKELDWNIVLGPNALHKEKVINQVQRLDNSVRLHIATPKMATLMSQADLAVGTAGTTTWERCTLGLPTAIIIAAENQRDIAQAVIAKDAVWLLTDYANDKLVSTDTLRAILSNSQEYLTKSHNAASLCDGLGLERVGKRLFDEKLVE